MRPSLGCYGDAIAKTPAIDRLAAKGVQFDRAYVQYPICGPSRASFLSGTRPQTTGYFGWKLTPGVTQLPTWFRNNGYFTAQFGKVYHHDHILGVPASQVKLITLLNPPGAWDLSDACVTEDDPGGYGYLYCAALRKEDSRAAKHVLARGSLCPEGLKSGWFWWEWAETDLPDEKTTDGIVVRRAVKAMEQAVREGKPFYIGAGLRRPHQLLVAPKRYFDLYPLDSIPAMPEEPPEHLAKIPSAAFNIERSRAYKIYTAEGRRKLWRAYYANVSFADAQVDVLLKALDRLDLWKNTVVILHSDNGWHLGEHGGQVNKDTLFDESTHTPLIIAAPGYGDAKARCPHPVELIDIFPTLADLFNLDAPNSLEGVSLKDLLQSPTGPAPRAGAVSVVYRHVNGRTVRAMNGQVNQLAKDAGKPHRILGRSVNTEKWCYTEWDVGNLGTELYNMTKDPRQLNNLSNSPELAAVRAKLKSLLRELDPTAADTTE